jgi:hypothetical protein
MVMRADIPIMEVKRITKVEATIMEIVEMITK